MRAVVDYVTVSDYGDGPQKRWGFKINDPDLVDVNIGDEFEMVPVEPDEDKVEGVK